MSQITAQGTVWNLPNYWGELFTADLVNTPFLSMIGGLTGGGRQSADFEFPTSVEYDFPSAAQPAITETASLTASTYTLEGVRAQKKNVCQIFMQSVMISYAKLSAAGRLSGINTVGASNSVADEQAWQINYNLQKIARDVEYTILNGAYNIATTAGTANKTRGMIALCDETGGTSVDASATALDKDLMQELFLDLFDAGAPFSNMVIWANGFQKQAISAIYGYAPEDRNVGGVNIKQIETDFGNIGIAPAHRFMPAATLLICEMGVIQPVTQPVPGKGNFFYEQLAKTGASENGQIYGQFGLDHGPAFMAGKIINLATS